MLVEILVLIGVGARTETAFAADGAVTAGLPNTTWLARSLFTDFLLPFEVAAVILTVAVIAAVMLTLRRRVGAKHQDPAQQTRVRAKDRFRMVRMDPVLPAAAPARDQEKLP
jgi:NADH-quinone oxidoreductase subunit J